MKLSKELLEAIERLGDQLTLTEELAKNIYKQIRKDFGIYNNTYNILHCLRSLNYASVSYTEFHERFLSNFIK